MTSDEILIALGPKPRISRGVWSRERHQWELRKIQLEGGFLPVFPSKIYRKKA